MYTIHLTTLINAPPSGVFALARDVGAHLASTEATGERVIAGRTSGLLELGEEITWEARHLGVRQRLTSRITAFDRPRYFQDTMVRGIFKSFVHDHHFEPQPDGTTVMTDDLRFSAPLGPLGWLAERLIVGPHLKHFLSDRASVLKHLAEADQTRVSMSDESSWPFDQPGNAASITLRSIVVGGAPILSVSHDADDHGWQFLGRGAFDMKDAAMVALEEIVRLDPTVLDVADLPPGWRAWRQSPTSPWQRAQSTP